MSQDVILLSILRPFVRFCIKRGIKVQDMVSALRALMQDEAKKILLEEGSPVSDSRVSAITGLHRKELRKKNAPEPAGESKNLIHRVINQWRYDPKFSKSSGKSRALSVAEFTKLVKTVSSDLNPYTVLYELEREEVLVRKDSKLTLKARVHITKEADHGFMLAGRDIYDLLGSVEENVLEDPDVPNLHLKTEYDNIASSDEDEIKKRLLEEGSLFHEKIRRFLAQFDRDLNRERKPREPAIRIGVGAFSVVRKASEEDR